MPRRREDYRLAVSASSVLRERDLCWEKLGAVAKGDDAAKQAVRLPPRGKTDFPLDDRVTLYFVFDYVKP